MTFEEWWSAEAAPGTHRGWEESCRQAYEVGRRAGLMCAAKKFESLLPTNWAYADGYANGADIAGELRDMAEKADV